LFLAGCDLAPCSNEPVSEAISQDGKYKAVTFYRDCGATTDYSEQISILERAQPLPNDGGNIFVTSGKPTVVVKWIDANHLSISGSGATTSKKETSFDGISITYP
jgi:hypothetical protein